MFLLVMFPLLLSLLGPLSAQASEAPIRPSNETLFEIAKGLNHPDLAVRRRASGDMAKMTTVPVETLPSLVRALREDSDHVVGQNVSRAIAKIGTAAVPALLELLRDKDQQTRVRAVLALGQMNPEIQEVGAALILALKDENRDVRYYAALDLGKRGTAVFPSLLQVLRNENPLVRAGAAEALENMGPQAREASPSLAKALQDTDQNVRYHAAYALARVDPQYQSVVPVLVQALKDADWLTRGRATDALGAMGGLAKDAVPTLSHVALRDRDTLVRSRAAQALGRIGPVDRAVVSTLTQVLKDKEPLVRGAAAQALGEIGTEAKDAVPGLILALGDEGAGVRMYAGEALTKIGPAAIPALIQAMKNQELYVRQEAVQAMRKISPLPQEAIQALVEALKDPNSVVRSEAEYGLRMSGSADAQKALAQHQQGRTLPGGREEARAQREKERLYSKEQVLATIPPNDEYKYPLLLALTVPVQGANQNELLITLHRGQDRPDRLVIWGRTKDRYKALTTMEAEEGPSFSSFATPQVFKFKGDIFIHVALLFSGTGSGHEDTIFAVLQDNTLQKVTFERAPAWYKSHLKKGEGIWKGESNVFSDDKLEFEFYIWNEGDANCCPTAGRVRGTYRILKGRRSDPAQKKWLTEWKMTVETHRREAVPAQ